MTAPQILGVALLAGVVLGYPLWRRAVRREKAQEQAASEWVALEYPTVFDAWAADVIKEAETYCRLGARDFEEGDA